MRKTRLPVLVRRLPQSVNAENVRVLLGELDSFLKADGPRLVFDLSQVEEMDAAGVDMLLRCVTEATKRDGDLKLAAPSARALVILELTQLDRLFEIFETPAEAAASFGVTLTTENADEPLASASSDGNGTESGESTPEPQLRSGRRSDSDVA